MKGWHALLACIGAAMLTAPVHAEILPRPGTGDPHIQSVLFDPQQVIALRVANGYAVTVQLSPEERIETVTLGDSSGWQVQVNRSADRLVVKPSGYPRPTNLTVVTDQRSYNFTLYLASISDEALPYMVSFTFPPPIVEQEAPLVQSEGRYRLSGTRKIRPSAISDDGEFTSVVWPKDAALPAVYKEDEPGQPALVNGLMRGGAYVVEGVYRKLIFVLGKSRAFATRIVPKEPG